MKLGVYQRFLLLFFLVFCSQALFLAAQEPIELPEGVPPESDLAYGQHLGQVEEMMEVSDLAVRERQLESVMKKLHPKSKILQYYESFFSRTVEDYQTAGQTQQTKRILIERFALQSQDYTLSTEQLPRQKYWAVHITIHHSLCSSSATYSLTATGPFPYHPSLTLRDEERPIDCLQLEAAERRLGCRASSPAWSS